MYACTYRCPRLHSYSCACLCISEDTYDTIISSHPFGSNILQSNKSIAFLRSFATLLIFCHETKVGMHLHLKTCNIDMVDLDGACQLLIFITF